MIDIIGLIMLLGFLTGIVLVRDLYEDSEWFWLWTILFMNIGICLPFITIISYLVYLFNKKF